MKNLFGMKVDLIYNLADLSIGKVFRQFRRNTKL